MLKAKCAKLPQQQPAPSAELVKSLAKEQERLLKLRPENVFGDRFLTKKDVKAYQKLLEDELKRWSRVPAAASGTALSLEASLAQSTFFTRRIILG